MSDCNQTGCKNMRSTPAYQQRGASASSYTRESCGRCSANRNQAYGSMNYASSRSGQNGGMHYRQNSSDCCQTKDPLCGFPLAMAYVPWQTWQAIYEPDQALCQGTIFMELDKPFLGCRGGRRS